MSRYGLGIDIGAGTVTAAVRSVEDTQPGGAVRVPVRDAGRDVEVPLALVLARVGDPTPFAGTGHEPRTAAQHLAAVVAGVRDEVGGAQGTAPGHTVVSVPPSWGDHRRADLGRALAEAIGESCTLASSAVAAARRHRPDAGGGTVAVFDIGAATVDTAVVRDTDDGGLEHAAVPPLPVRWGGRDIDDALLQHVCTAVGLPGPSSAAPGRGRARLAALREACTAAKERLSSELAVRVDVDHPDEYVRLVRADLDELIAGSVAESVAALRGGVLDAGLAPDQLDGVVLAGGGALVPLVAATLSAELDVPLLVTDEPAVTVAAGAAELAADLLASQQQALSDDPAAATASTGTEAIDIQAIGSSADVDEDEGADVVDLAAHRRNRRSQAGVRTGVVAALLAALLVAPLSLMDALHGDVRTRSAPGAAVAGEPSTAPAAPVPPAPAEAAAPDATTEPAAAAPPSKRSTATREDDIPARATSSSPRAAARPGTTAKAPVAPAQTPGTTAPPRSPAAASSSATTPPPTVQSTTPPPPTTTAPPATTTAPPAVQSPVAPPPDTTTAPPPDTQSPAEPPPDTQGPAAPPPDTTPAPPPDTVAPDGQTPDAGGAGAGAP